MIAPTTIEAPNVERHEMPSGAVIYYRDSDHSYWRAHDGRQVAGRVPGISTIAKAGTGDTGSVDGLITWGIKLYKQGVDFKKKREQAASDGTAVHKTLELLARGQTIAAYDDGGHRRAVVDWWHTRHPNVREAEFFVYDPRRGFAGQPDLFYSDGRDLTLLDLKTGSIRPEAFVQLNLYRVAMRESGFPAPRRLLLLDTRGDGTWCEVGVPIRPDWATNAITIYKQGKEIDKAHRAAAHRAAAHRAATK